jgi:starch phosphorylase
MAGGTKSGTILQTRAHWAIEEVKRIRARHTGSRWKPRLCTICWSSDVIRSFYNRGPDRLPRKWIERMKASISSLCHFVNTLRMVSDYGLLLRGARPVSGA